LDGNDDGSPVGWDVGNSWLVDGRAEGSMLKEIGEAVGASESTLEGSAVGTTLEDAEGSFDGILVGVVEGSTLDSIVGD
jgi:hypothetical protein